MIARERGIVPVHVTVRIWRRVFQDSRTCILADHSGFAETEIADRIGESATGLALPNVLSQNSMNKFTQLRTSMSQSRPNCIDLFAGAGGLGLGFELADKRYKLIANGYDSGR